MFCSFQNDESVLFPNISLRTILSKSKIIPIDRYSGRLSLNMRETFNTNSYAATEPLAVVTIKINKKPFYLILIFSQINSIENSNTRYIYLGRYSCLSLLNTKYMKNEKHFPSRVGIFSKKLRSTTEY